MSQRTFFAEWILPVVGDPIHNGYVSIEENKIVGLGNADSFTGDRSAAQDLGTTVIFPALVNTLFHPDYPEAENQTVYKGNFLGWLNAARQYAKNISATEIESLILSSIKRCYDYGTAAIGIRTAHPEISVHLEHSGIYSTIFHLLRGFRSYEAKEIWRTRKQFEDTDLLKFHAAGDFLFNLAPEIFREIAKANSRTALPLAFLKDEEIFFAKGLGRIYQYLLGREDMDYRWKPPQCSPIHYFLSNAFAARDNILSQMIMVTEEELDLLNDRSETFHICLHPRFDRAWELGTSPGQLIQSRGFNICLGTFAEHMDMRREMRSASAEYGFKPPEILEMATLNGARALGFSDRIGSLEIGKDAKIFSVSSESSISDPNEYILLSTAKMLPVT